MLINIYSSSLDALVSTGAAAGTASTTAGAAPES